MQKGNWEGDGCGFKLIVNEETEPVLSDRLLAAIQVTERWREITPLFALLESSRTAQRSEPTEPRATPEQ